MSPELSPGPLTPHTCHREEEFVEKEKTQGNVTNHCYGLSFFNRRVGLLPALCRAQHLGWPGSWQKLSVQQALSRKALYVRMLEATSPLIFKAVWEE